jgi:hypothetical protein
VFTISVWLCSRLARGLSLDPSKHLSLSAWIMTSATVLLRSPHGGCVFTLSIPAKMITFTQRGDLLRS